MMLLLRLLWSYLRTRSLRFTDRAALERHQAQRLHAFEREVLTKSPYFTRLLGTRRESWPTMNKHVMMENFDAINTAGLNLSQVLSTALRSEATRDFSPTVGRHSVGLSSGTSGRRGVFVVSPEEQARWAGVMLAKLLPNGLLNGERVALFLRANNNLYKTVRTPWLAFRFFDLFVPFETLMNGLRGYAPTIVVAPAQVLRALALAHREGRIDLGRVKAISVAEVLEPQDRVLLRAAFADLGEVYQATEGFLGATCAHGTLHLNEEFLKVEPEWIDDKRFVPVVTDFTRRTQPVVRYRLDDILVRRTAPCPCGSPTMALAAIEGRCDDLLRLPGADGRMVDVFADVVSRALAQSLPATCDYRLVQSSTDTLELHIPAGITGGDGVAARAQAHLCEVFARLGVAVSALRWHIADQLPAADFATKRRRITSHLGRRAETAAS